jgi:hypothetical protein
LFINFITKNFSPKKTKTMFVTTETTDQQVHLKIAPTTEKGTPVTTPATFTLKQGAGVLTADADGLGATLAAGASAEDVIITATIGTYSEDATVTVSQAPVTTAGFSADAPVNKP